MLSVIDDFLLLSSFHILNKINKNPKQKTPASFGY